MSNAVGMWHVQSQVCTPTRPLKLRTLPAWRLRGPWSVKHLPAIGHSVCAPDLSHAVFRHLVVRSPLSQQKASHSREGAGGVHVVPGGSVDTRRQQSVWQCTRETTARALAHFFLLPDLRTRDALCRTYGTVGRVRKIAFPLTQDLLTYTGWASRCRTVWQPRLWPRAGQPSGRAQKDRFFSILSPQCLEN